MGPEASQVRSRQRRRQPQPVGSKELQVQTGHFFLDQPILPRPDGALRPSQARIGHLLRANQPRFRQARPPHRRAVEHNPQKLLQVPFLLPVRRQSLRAPEQERHVAVGQQILALLQAGVMVILCGGSVMCVALVGPAAVICKCGSN